MPKHSRLDDPGYAENVADLLASGLTNDKVAAALGDGTHPDTVKRWARHPKVQAHLSRLREERVNRVTRKIDSVIEGRLSDETALREMDMKDLVALRRELLGPAAQRVVVNRGVDEAEATADLMSALARNPELAKALGAEGVADGFLLEQGQDDIEELDDDGE
jgi:hypothetical protein